MNNKGAAQNSIEMKSLQLIYASRKLLMFYVTGSKMWKQFSSIFVAYFIRSSCLGFIFPFHRPHFALTVTGGAFYYVADILNMGNVLCGAFILFFMGRKGSFCYFYHKYFNTNWGFGMQTISIRSLFVLIEKQIRHIILSLFCLFLSKII